MNEDNNKSCVWRVNLGFTPSKLVSGLRQAESHCHFHLGALTKEDECWDFTPEDFQAYRRGEH